MSARDETIIRQQQSLRPNNDVPSSPLFKHATSYYQKKIIFACNSKQSNKDLTQLVIRVGRMHKNQLLDRINADILLRLVIEGYCSRSDIEKSILYFHPQININYLAREDLCVLYNARVTRLLSQLEAAEDANPTISNEELLNFTSMGQQSRKIEAPSSPQVTQQPKQLSSPSNNDKEEVFDNEPPLLDNEPPLVQPSTLNPVPILPTPDDFIPPKF
mmetsp:Transcript_1726/g.2540  ORF Transcript_1726/g.2540 Transcript_1726/m.2540 type:complete len:217 (+) Transcript_1726:64-714(+)